MPDIIDRFREAADVRKLGFAEFTTDLITDTADAIVASTIKQIRSFGELVKELAQGLAAFQEKNAGPGAVREFLVLNFPNTAGDDTIVQVDADYNLAQYNDIIAKLGPIDESVLARPEPGSTEMFSEEGVAAIQAATRNLLLERAARAYEQLENLIRVGYARVVFDDGHILTRLKFNVNAVDRDVENRSRTSTTSSTFGGGIRGGLFGPIGAAFGWAQLGFGGRKSNITVESVSSQSFEAITMDANILGEVRVDFKTETFDLEKLRLTSGSNTAEPT